jgi:Protein of unknown function (DUF998)
LDDGILTRRIAIMVLAGLLASMAMTAAAPLLIPGGYSWVSQSVSEAAAQGLEGAWLARLGFLTFGWSVLALARLASPRWGFAGTASFVTFGAAMTAAAAFSHQPWLDTPPADDTEDLLHSIAATGMGFAFAFGVAIVAVREARLRGHIRAFDALAIVASFLLPMAGGLWGGVEGVLQRVLFLVGYAWYAREALRLLKPQPNGR